MQGTGYIHAIKLDNDRETSIINAFEATCGALHEGQIMVRVSSKVALTTAGVLPWMMTDGIVHIDLFDGFTLPVIKDGAADARIRYLLSKGKSRNAVVPE